MPDYDDFFLDPEGLEEEASLGPVEKAKLEIMEKIEEIVKEAKRNIQYKEAGDFRANFIVLSRYVGAMTELEYLIDPQLDVMKDFDGDKTQEKLTDEQILDMIDDIMLSVKELSFTDLKEYENREKTVQIHRDPDKDDDDDYYGF
jgi:hypothetical protein